MHGPRASTDSHSNLHCPSFSGVSNSLRRISRQRRAIPQNPTPFSRPRPGQLDVAGDRSPWSAEDYSN
jgi:hypothetical protein